METLRDPYTNGAVREGDVEMPTTTGSTDHEKRIAILEARMMDLVASINEKFGATTGRLEALLRASSEMNDRVLGIKSYLDSESSIWTELKRDFYGKDGIQGRIQSLEEAEERRRKHYIAMWAAIWTSLMATLTEFLHRLIQSGGAH